MSKKLTQEEFLTKAVAAHGAGRYDYSHVLYTNAFCKVKIICPEHGAFEQEAKAHKKGAGCQKCGKKSAGNTQMLGASEFLRIAQALHGINRYDYSQVIYRGNKSKVKIICPEHGAFEQTPNSHTVGRNGKGSNCPECARRATTDSLRLSAEDVIARSMSAHGLRYDYSQVDYQHGGKKTIIICPKHGAFMQAMQVHQKGHGCPGCAKEVHRLHWVKKANGRIATIYLLRLFNQQEEFFKVGITFLSVSERYNCKRAIGFYDYEVLATSSSSSAAAIYDWEQSILETFAHLRYSPQNNFGGETECFSSAEEILTIFPL